MGRDVQPSGTALFCFQETPFCLRGERCNRRSQSRASRCSSVGAPSLWPVCPANLPPLVLGIDAVPVVRAQRPALHAQRGPRFLRDGGGQQQLLLERRGQHGYLWHLPRAAACFVLANGTGSRTVRLERSRSAARALRSFGSRRLGRMWAALPILRRMSLHTSVTRRMMWRALQDEA